MEIKRLGKNDIALFRELIQLFQEVFEMEGTLEFDESYLSQLLDNDNFIAYAAISDDTIAGGLTAYVLPMYYSQSAEAYIYDIAVSPAFQRMEIGRQLMNSLTLHCKQNDIKVIFVEAHEEDTHAIDFYHSAGGKAEKVVHFNFEITPDGNDSL